MFTLNGILVTLCAIIAMSSYASAFFINWGAPEPIKIHRQPNPNYYYHKRYEVPQNYPQINTVEQQVPAVPIQVPLQAQLSALPNIHNVQLVPCLCPVTPDVEFQKIPDNGKGVYVSQIKNSQR